MGDARRLIENDAIETGAERQVYGAMETIENLPPHIRFEIMGDPGKLVGCILCVR